MKIALVHFNHTKINGLVGWADLMTARWTPNYGDMLVCAAILNQINLDQPPVRVGFGQLVKQDIDLAIVRGSTYLHKDFNFDAAIKTLESISAPVAIVGLGAQSPVNDPTFLDGHPGAIRFLELLREKSASISVRGAFSAEVVNRLCPGPVRITGCPSLFHDNTAPHITPSPLLASDYRRLGVSIHTGLSQGIFCRAPDAARARHGDVIDYAIRSALSVAIFEQGNKQEYIIAAHDHPFDERRRAAQGVLREIRLHDRMKPEELIARMVSVKSIQEWLAKARDLDAIIGFRFHGNMVALCQGSPCFYYVYDSRLKEFCDLYALPYDDVEDAWRDPVEAMLAHDWTRANEAMSGCFDQLAAFYSENGVAHKLTNPDVVTA